MAVKGLDVGLMTAEIVLQTAEAVQSDSGEQTFDWDNAEEQALWAQWLPAGSRESWQAQQRLGAYVDGVFKMYDFDSVDERPSPDDTRILYNGRVYDTKPYIEIYEEGAVVGLEIAVVARAET